MKKDDSLTNKNYNEAMELLVEARLYLSRNRFNLDMISDPIDRLIYCRESTRLTTRLTHVIGWLMTQKAVNAGEITWNEAMTTYQSLENEKICNESMKQDEAELPNELMGLLQRSEDMFSRISRLDSLVRKNLSLS